MEKNNTHSGNINKKAALISCSNGLPLHRKDSIHRLVKELEEMGLSITEERQLFAGEVGESYPAAAPADRRAERLMQLFEDSGIGWIFDVSGGDMANEILPFLDYETIRESEAVFWGYSDLTTVINAIYARTGKASVLYQIRNLTEPEGQAQREGVAALLRKKDPALRNADVCETDENSLFAFPYHFEQYGSLREEVLEGIVVGGNIRCLLKLAGTIYWPDMNGKILLLEAMGGGVAQMTTYLSQLKQMGVFDQVRGILLGTFSQMERDGALPDMTELVKRFAGKDMPIVKTDRIGHGADAKAIRIGQKVCLSRCR